MKNIIVFGGAGFLGSYLVEELMKRGYNLTVCDLDKGLYFNDEISFFECDILNPVKVREAFTGDPQIVYNLAGFANLDKAVDHPYRTMELNVMGNINILNASIEAGVKRFVYASSAYAMNNKGSFYGISKLTSEKLVEEYNKRYDLPYTILRYGSVYSERSFENNYIFQIVKQAIEQGKIVHEGDGEEIREYIHAHDAATLSVDIIESEKYLNEQIILTGVERMRRIELFKMIKEILNRNLEIDLKKDGYGHHFRYTPYSFEASVSKKLVANPHIDMGQGLLRCIKAIHSND